MDIRDYARHSQLPYKILHWMVREKIINNPLIDDDLIGLRLLETVWGKREVLRTQLSRLSSTRRRQLIETAHLKSKWERYAYSRFRNLPKGEKLPLRKLIDEIELTYGFTLKREHIRRLYKVRKQVYNQRIYERKTLLKTANK